MNVKIEVNWEDVQKAEAHGRAFHNWSCPISQAVTRTLRLPDKGGTYASGRYLGVSMTGRTDDLMPLKVLDAGADDNLDVLVAYQNWYDAGHDADDLEGAARYSVHPDRDDPCTDLNFLVELPPALAEYVSNQ